MNLRQQLLQKKKKKIKSLYSLYYAQTCNEFAWSVTATMHLGNTAPFEEKSQRWRVVGNSVFDLNPWPPAPELSTVPHRLSGRWKSCITHIIRSSPLKTYHEVRGLISADISRERERGLPRLWTSVFLNYKAWQFSRLYCSEISIPLFFNTFLMSLTLGWWAMISKRTENVRLVHFNTK